MFRTLTALTLGLLLLIGIAAAQGWWDKKPFSEWSKDEAQGLLNESPWCKTLPLSAYQEDDWPGIPERGVDQRSVIMGRDNPAAYSRNSRPMPGGLPIGNLRLRFITARPVRLALDAFARLEPNSRLDRDDWQRFVREGDHEHIILAIDVDAYPTSPGATASQFLAYLMSISTTDLAADTTLALTTGNKVYLSRYVPPTTDGLGARFYFPRKLADGREFVQLTDKEVRFRTTLPRNPRTIWMVFSLDKMIFDGKLEI